MNVLFLVGEYLFLLIDINQLSTKKRERERNGNKTEKDDPLPPQFGEGIDFMFELRIGQELTGIVSYVNAAAREGVYVDIGLKWKRPDGFRERALIPLAAIARYTSVRVGQTVKVRVAALDRFTLMVRLDLVEPRFVHFTVG